MLASIGSASCAKHGGLEGKEGEGSQAQLVCKSIVARTELYLSTERSARISPTPAVCELGCVELLGESSEKLGVKLMSQMR